MFKNNGTSNALKKYYFITIWFDLLMILELRIWKNYKASLSRFAHIKTGNIILAGDFTLGNTNWEVPVFIPNSNDAALHTVLLGIRPTTDFSLSQLNLNPTRGERILELFLTNSPNALNRIEVIINYC